MRTSITMMFGHIETIAERIEHLRLIRELQDETGGFTAFICWTFQPDGTPLGRMGNSPRTTRAEPDGKHLLLAGSHEYLRMLALSRVFLDNIANVQSSWVTHGPGHRPARPLLRGQRHGLGDDGGERGVSRGYDLQPDRKRDPHPDHRRRLATGQTQLLLPADRSIG
jgi:hypothetical protein